MDGIEGVSGVGAVPGGAASAHALPLRRVARSSAVVPARQPAAPALPDGGDASRQVRAGGIGSDGRFEKLILAVQALRIGFAEERPTARIEEMRAAAEEIFQIDGVPAPVEPAAEAGPEIEFPTSGPSVDAESPPMRRAEPAEPAATAPPPAEAAPATGISES
jgi:hypothetical protein